MAIVLRSGTARAVILPEHGGRLHQLYLAHGTGEEALLWAPDDPSGYSEQPTHGGSFPMAPWPNRIAGSQFSFEGGEFRVPSRGKPNAIHGRVLDVPWTIVARTKRVCELTAGFDDGWPWAGKAWQRYEITDTGLRMKLEVRADRAAFPAGCGWHPWFRRDVFGAPDVRLSLSASERYVSADDLPTGEFVTPHGEFDFSGGPLVGARNVDTCYRGIAGPIDLTWGDRRLCIEVSTMEPHMMVYTRAYALCVEPQTCAPDAFNLASRGAMGTGYAVAEPGRPVTIESRWSWR